MHAVLAVCDPDPRVAEQAAAGWGARVFPHYAPLLRDETPDALFVCVPPCDDEHSYVSF